ncbi:heme o synthase [Leptospira noguchii]|uniref:Protoheme IX farnesyltransferase n=2 Tax=Leptospira noguchii TaxID=28182 RepID=M6UC29_9LEPT|nr:heme o synthase [Leptospira noguchii]EMO30298.1 protoheme IX farnesyltransferase [Leptospira interrogans serovar Bataviae str. HAI135]EKR75019.1 protoheme IX farnesyltransferase [Leptospira noguchii str. 2006001870]EMI67275.1 protoheme IX farnesyltransferase [Leptospira noguchii str. Bonito]EMO42582.1 protoheme IX farnesyltransferase [Leptospira noguchii serovar Autumnalis str. ZUN142]EMS82523.1 protoheme IX farnesyltransferase [Leptospira noguchii str. Hook]
MASSTFFSDWNQMLKPRVTSLVLATIIPGLYLASEQSPSGFLITITLFGTFLMSSASFIFNQVIEKDRDAKMKRTLNRPIPSGRISVVQATLVGLAMMGFSFYVLVVYVNLLTALCAFAALISYVFLYTIFLKPRTTQNIVIGGVAGCVGPLIGYAAIGNSLPVQAWVLFMMIFLWTPAHFWALAIFLKEEYSDADFPMLPVVKGIHQTTKSIFFYTIFYSIACVSFYFLESSMGFLYLITALVVCIWMGILSYQLIQSAEPQSARKFFFFSIFHLFIINITIVIDHLI